MDESAGGLIYYRKHKIVLRPYDLSCVMLRQRTLDYEIVRNDEFVQHK